MIYDYTNSIWFLVVKMIDKEADGEVRLSQHQFADLQW